LTNILFVGADWVMKYLIGKILLDDQDGEDQITVFDTTQTVNEFYDFPPLQKFAGDERLVVANTLDVKKALSEYGPFDVIIVSTNILDQVQQLCEVRFVDSPKFLVISSWEVYGWKGRRQLPISEDEKLAGETELAMVKKEIEKIMTYSFPCTIFRLSTIFGPYMPEESEVIQWLMNLIISRKIVIAQPAGRKIDFCYIYNVLEPIQKAMTKENLPKIINLGSSDNDFKTDGKLNVFEKNIVEALMGIRVLVDSHSQITTSDEDPTVYQGKGFHSQLRTELARKHLEYFPMIDTLRGFLQTCHWLQKRMALDPQFATLTGRDIEEIYPTLDDKKVMKVGEEIKSRDIEEIEENLYQERLIKNKQGTRLRKEADEASPIKKAEEEE